MRKIFPALATTGLILLGCAVLSVSVLPAAQAQAPKAKAKAPKINPKVLKPLQAAVELTNAGNFAEAEVQLQAAEAVESKGRSRVAGALAGPRP